MREERRHPRLCRGARRGTVVRAPLLCAAVLLGVGGGVPAATATPDFDPDRTQGGFDLWMVRPLPGGGFDTPVNLGPPVNTSRSEITPVISPDGQRLFFASRSRRDSQGGYDLYVAAREGEGWGEPVPLGVPVNSAADELGPCMLPDGQTLLFSREDAAQQAYDLVLTVEVEGEWLEPIRFGEPLYTPGEERMASITADGSQLFFTALWRSGRGSFDLYTSYRDDSGSWGEAVNMGPRVNSQESDYSPGVSPDGSQLYFSSQRDEIGNFDLYRTELTPGGTWGEPERLPAPVNTRATEYCPFVAPDGTLYFASDRRQGTVDTRPPIEE